MNLSDKILSMLSEQYRMETYNSLRYDQRRAFCDYNGFSGCAAFYKQEAEGERGHAQKVLDFLLDRSAFPIIEPVTFNDPSPINNSALYETFASALIVERDTTASLTAIYQAACAEGDIMTAHFMLEMIALQVEEERDIQLVLDRYRNYPASPSRDNDIDVFVSESLVN